MRAAGERHRRAGGKADRGRSRLRPALGGCRREHERILQIGHLERFNPAVAALKKITGMPLFFEIHRLSLFSPRSLDVDVVLDLMIHDLDIVLDLAGAMPEEIRAAGISILSDKVDIANVRLAFPGGCIANLTASRVSTERVRKLRLFQPHQYISLDYQKQEAVAFTVGGNQQIGFQPLAVAKESRCGWKWKPSWKLSRIAAGHWCRAKKDCGRSKWLSRFLIKLKSTRSWSRNGFNHLPSNFRRAIDVFIIRPS